MILEEGCITDFKTRVLNIPFGEGKNYLANFSLEFKVIDGIKLVSNMVRPAVCKLTLKQINVFRYLLIIEGDWTSSFGVTAGNLSELNNKIEMAINSHLEEMV